ncbi:MAG: FtsX-like permease family protein [Bacteroidetes bacterium]|jgi:putative ABC transport system permease protein|nr:FtsX-like permease family protein [Bacteroidota bacterium]
MLKNYFKIAWRNLWKNKLYSLINISGLSIGIAACVVIFLYVQFEWSYDRHYENTDRIYRLTEILHLPKEDRQQAATSPPMAPTLKRNFPEIEDFTRILFSGRALSFEHKKIADIKIVYADSGMYTVFGGGAIEGNLKRALNKPYSIVLTESLAKKCFGNTHALGKVMQFSDTINLTVTAVVKDVPETSHLTYDCVVSKITSLDMNKETPGFMENEENWFNNSNFSYLLLKKNTNKDALQKKINFFAYKQMAEERKTSGLYYDFVLQPLKDIHLHSKMDAEIDASRISDISYIYIFSAAAILIMLIACSNFINLSTARSIARGKEIGLRKVIGAERKQLIIQFLSESVLFTLIAAVISMLLVYITISPFRNFTGKMISFDLLHNNALLLIYFSIIVVVGVLAGFYPALLMSSFAPIRSLKGLTRHSWQDILLRKGLVVFQFTIAIVLIIGSSLVMQQIDFVQNTNIGFNKEQIFQVGLERKAYEKKDLLIKEFERQNGVLACALSDFSFSNGISNISLLPEGASENEITSQSVICTDGNFLNTYQLKLVAGRDFSKAMSTDPTQAFIVNEAAVKFFNWGSPQKAIGKKIDWGLGKKGNVIGVVKDFNYKSLHEQIEPLIIHIQPDWTGNISMRIKAGESKQALANLQKAWSSIVQDEPFDYQFLDDDFDKLFKGEQNMRVILNLFTVLAVLIACLGLFGLVSYTIKQRVKEIGVRKVLGASIKNISVLLSKDFLKLVCIAVIIATPLAWYCMNKWLQNFAFHIEIGWITFLIAGVLTICIALLTVSLQAAKAANANPVKSLRTE